MAVECAHVGAVPLPVSEEREPLEPPRASRALARLYAIACPKRAAARHREAPGNRRPIPSVASGVGRSSADRTTLPRGRRRPWGDESVRWVVRASVASTALPPPRCPHLFGPFAARRTTRPASVVCGAPQRPSNVNAGSSHLRGAGQCTDCFRHAHGHRNVLFSWFLVSSRRLAPILQRAASWRARPAFLPSSDPRGHATLSRSFRQLVGLRSTYHQRGPIAARRRSPQSKEPAARADTRLRPPGTPPCEGALERAREPKAATR